MTVKEIRKRTGLSQSAFARATGISVRTLQQWEQGRSQPPAYVESLIERVVAQGSISAASQPARTSAETENRIRCAGAEDSVPSQSSNPKHEAALARLENGDYTIPAKSS